MTAGINIIPAKWQDVDCGIGSTCHIIKVRRKFVIIGHSTGRAFCGKTNNLAPCTVLLITAIGAHSDLVFCAGGKIAQISNLFYTG